MNLSSVFIRRTLATICMFEGMSAAEDADYLEDGEIAQYHAELHMAPMDIVLADDTVTYRIVDQYGNMAGVAEISNNRATISYSVYIG